MQKFFFAVIVLFFSNAGLTVSQEIYPLSTTAQLDSLKNLYTGKVILINIWASWCVPCVKEFPDLIKLYSDYKDKGFELIFISVDETSEIKTRVMPFLKKQKVEFDTYYNKFSNFEELINYIDPNWEGAIPATYIYNKKGKLKKIIIGQTEYSEVEKIILKYLQ